jgi:hypothetical protein
LSYLPYRIFAELKAFKSQSQIELMCTPRWLHHYHVELTGVPQVSIPGAEVDGLPVGLSIERQGLVPAALRRRITFS